MTLLILYLKVQEKKLRQVILKTLDKHHMRTDSSISYLRITIQLMKFIKLFHARSLASIMKSEIKVTALILIFAFGFSTIAFAQLWESDGLKSLMQTSDNANLILGNGAGKVTT